MGKSTVTIEQIINKEYRTEDRLNRRTGEVCTQEFFTPADIVFHMCDKVSKEKWKDTTANFLEPSFGNGNFLLAIIYLKIKNGSTPEVALQHTYGVELMRDNVDEAKERILEMLDEFNYTYDKDLCKSIMDNNLVCSDFFKWDFENWKPISEPKTTALF